MKNILIKKFGYDKLCMINDLISGEKDSFEELKELENTVAQHLKYVLVVSKT